ncbi:polysaccharide deacetylase family protein, partial [bacterium]|nr:polysaccharide deacetylase family protein [bacterium]
MKDKIIDWILTNSNNPLVMGAITFTTPERFLNSIYSRNKGNKPPWMNKSSCLSISFDVDYPEDVDAIPYVLGLLKDRPFKTSFACVGYYIEQKPDIHKMILDEGHEILNHTYSHPDNELLNPGRRFVDISDDEKFEEIEKCHEVCQKLLNYTPIGFRIPHFKKLFTPKIYDFLHKLGYKYSSSTWITGTKSNGMPYLEKNGIIEIPLSTCPKHPFTVFDTWHSLRAKRLSHRIKHRTPEQYISLFEKL